MPLISSTSTLAAMIRAQIAAQARWNDVRSKLPEQTPASQTQEPQSLLDEGHQLQALVASRIHALSPDEPRRSRSAFRIFLESVLIQEFGASILLSPDFGNLVEQVITQMEADAELEQLILVAGESLLQNGSPGTPGIPK